MNKKGKEIWDNIELLEKQKQILENELEKARKKGGVFTLNAEIMLGQMKSRLAELKGEKRNLVKCSVCGFDIDLDNSFDCWKDGDKYSHMGCGIKNFMGIKQNEAK